MKYHSIATKESWKRIVDNKMRGAYGETDYKKKTIRINKKAHNKPRYGIAKKDATLINTIIHEELHKKHPKRHEKTIRKQARKTATHLSTKNKQRLYKIYS